MCWKENNWKKICRKKFDLFYRWGKKGKYKNFIFNNFVFFDLFLFKKVCNNLKKKIFLKDVVILVIFMM